MGKFTRPIVALMLILLLVVGCIGRDAPAEPEPLASYECLVYMEQGCAKQVVASGGEVEVQSGGTLDLQSGSTVNIAGTLASDGGSFTISDDLLVTGASDLRGNVTDGAGALTFADNTMIDGAADAIQLQVQGYTTQTNSLMVLEQSDGTDKFTVSNAGNTVVGGTLTSSGAFAASTTSAFTDKATFNGEMVYGATTTGPADGSTLTIAATFYVITSTANITFTLGTTGATAGQIVTFYFSDNNTVLIADTNIRSSDGNAISMGQYDVLMMIYSGSEWIELAKSANS